MGEGSVQVIGGFVERRAPDTVMDDLTWPEVKVIP
jgi:hypothetical protein